MIRIGEVFGNLTVTGIDPRKRRTYYKCSCSCGNSTYVRGDSLRTGNTKGCGSSVHRVIHGGTTKYSKIPEYNTWCEMKERCLNPKDPGYRNYGGRGIKMYTPWIKDFGAFLEHIGRKPEPSMSVERINNDGNYEPGNVKWATTVEQLNNTRRNIWITLKGEKLTIAQAARKYGLKYITLQSRHKKGIRGDDLISAIKEGPWNKGMRNGVAWSLDTIL